jgi:hypothetical protein
LSYGITIPVSYSRNAAGETSARQQTAYGNVTPTVGAGVKKGPVQLDVVINPANWAGLVSGPAVGTVTLTARF